MNRRPAGPPGTSLCSAAPGRDPWNGSVDKWRIIEPLLADLPAGSRILECGAGGGLYTIHMLRRGYHVTAVDISAEALAANYGVAERQGLARNLETVHGRFEHVAGQVTGPIDAAVFFKTLHHFPDLASIRKGIEAGYDAVRPGGILIGLEPNGQCPFWRLGILLAWLYRRGPEDLWTLEKNLTLITEPNLSTIFRQLPGARWQIDWQYPIPARLAHLAPSLFGPINRLLTATPLRTRAFNLTFRVWKPPAAEGAV